MRFKKLESEEKSKSGIRNGRLLVTAVLSVICASGCKLEEGKIDKDLAGVESEPDADHVSREYLMPIAKKNTDIIICEELDFPDSGQAEPNKPDMRRMSEQEYNDLYERVVEALRIKNGRGKR